MKLKYYNSDEVNDFLDDDDSIYHFTKKETAIEYILKDKVLKFGDFKHTNDPQERRKVRIPSIWGNVEDQKVLEIENIMQQIRLSSGFLSFCQNNYNENKSLEAHGCLKSRMWSQYGENHSGICLVFSKEKLLQEIENQMSSIYEIYPDEITYTDSKRKQAEKALRGLSGQEVANKKSIEIVFEHISKKKQAFFFNKQIDYRDENEYRIVVVPKSEEKANGALCDISQSIKTIILGESFPEVYLPTIQTLSKELNVPYRKLSWEMNSYFL